MNESERVLYKVPRACSLKRPAPHHLGVYLLKLQIYPVFVFCGLAHSFLMTRRKTQGNRIIPFLQIGKRNRRRVTQGRTTANTTAQGQKK